ncbi:unnamed protein product [Spirodela intermedia]|uniref:Uncharacterized protein n=1 Tax=Spirodela intermedia TaxID=51605 RepID=A0A7I8IH58_SPIIN|nr:unnamed protein product [Spirodela intermedia]CAA6657211.1 unnamed protein product [Spirodela intermedia]
MPSLLHHYRCCCSQVPRALPLPSRSLLTIAPLPSLPSPYHCYCWHHRHLATMARTCQSTFHKTLTPTEYDVLHYANGTYISTSVSLASLLASSTLDVFMKNLIDISYNITCTKFDIFDLYALT